METISEVSSTNLIILNDDVLLEALKYMNVFDVIAFRQVCQRFEFLADDFLSRKVKHFRIDAAMDTKSKEIIKNLGQHLHTLHLVSVHSPLRIDKLRHQISLINKHCTKLTALKIEVRKWYGSAAINASLMAKLRFQHLRQLELQNIKMEKDLELVPAFENLESLKLDSITNFSGQSLVNMRKLKTLHLTSCAQLKPNNLYDYFKACDGSLNELLVHKCRDIDEIIINQICLHLPNIERISIVFSYVASYDPSVLNRLQHLKSLSLHNFQTYNINGFIERLAANNSLESWEINGENMKIYRLDESTIDQLERSRNICELSFVKCNFVSDDLLLRLSRLCLKKFSVRDCWGFSSNGLMRFVELSKKLTYLSIKNCTILKSATIDIANKVLEDDERPSIQIDFDIDCGYRPYEDFYDDDDDPFCNNFDGYCDSNDSDDGE